jgi:RNA polymerase sigma-70 factor, ECF subfamily
MGNEQSSFASSVADLAALGQLVEQYQPRLLAMLQRRIDPRLNVRIDPQEILNDAFLLAGRKWMDFKAQSSMTAYAWIYRIVLDTLYEAWRRESRDCRDLRKELPMPDGSSLQLGLCLIETDTSPSKAVVREELVSKVHQCLALLKPGDREVLWMRHNDQLSFAEIGTVLDLTINTATVRYARALRRMKEHWQHFFEDPS